MTTRSGQSAPIGARVAEGGVEFRVWAPASEQVDVVIYGPDAERVHPLAPEGGGYFGGHVEGAGAGTRYRFRLDARETYPDPASRSQPEGVHGPSEVVDPGSFRWTDQEWRGCSLADLVIYELHVGAFTPEGTFDGAIGKLDELVELGVTAIEIMPIANFPGGRNWGYDGVNLYAPATAYGGPEGFKRLVNAAHGAGLAVLLDVVYNHLGPEGNYLPAVTGGRIFTERHETPWGAAVNYDGADSGPVREFVIGNALYWVTEYHVDGLRLDATHAIIDDSPVHLLQELAERVHAVEGPPRLLIAEDERNERRVVLPVEQGGYGLDGVWADDLHHQLRRHAAGDREGYFESYTGTATDVVTTLRKGWFYEGQLSPHSGEHRGTSAEGIPPMRFVHCLQNHDQVGNRAFGDRLTETVDLPVYRALSVLLLCSPYTPLLWMGQEWAASSPFQYFTEHPEELGRLVTEGRREEFGGFSAFQDPETRERIPDPQAPETFQNSKLRWEERDRPPHDGALRLYRELLQLRRRHPSLRDRDRAGFAVAAIGDAAIAMLRRGEEDLLVVLNFGGELSFDVSGLELPGVAEQGRWSVLLRSEEERFGGSGGGGTVGDQGRVSMPGPGALILHAQAA
jgi:maltooligosyltrehalose trehalohydrolase